MSSFGDQEALAITGSVRVNTAGTTVYGAGATGVAAFTTQIQAGDTIVIGTTRYVVSSVNSDSSLTVTESVGATGVQAGYVMQAPKYLSDDEKKNHVYGVDVTEAGVTAGIAHPGWVLKTEGSGYITSVPVLTAGSGYASTTPALSIVGTAGATGALLAVMSGGKLSSVTVQDGGQYTALPTVTVAAPAALSFNISSNVSATAETITFATNHNLAAGDALTYSFAGSTGPVGATGPIGLRDTQKYYAKPTGATGIQLYTTYAGAIAGTTGVLVNLGATGLSQTHTLTGDTATAGTVVMGGRFGRVKYETLVANSGIASDLEDVAFPDA